MSEHPSEPSSPSTRKCRISDECYAEARRLLRDNRDRLDRIVERLLEHKTLASGRCTTPRASRGRPAIR